ncbi:MAG TPA: glycosyltransferase family 39 protein [Solirubrobacterales bacterium]|nr:glycosyltransferase family 39 protein [Solirubrobacterales bacterium]
MSTRARNLLTPAAWVAAVTAALLLLFPRGFPNYDTIYSLLWGREIAEGLSPDRGAALPPTPHPLSELFGAAVSPLGDGAIDVTMVIAYVVLGLIGYLVYRLGSLWFDRPIGAVAALIVLTRAPYLSNGLRAYIDLPYIALVLAALVLETRRPRAGWPVLVLLAMAGLLRPEAWLFSFAYLAYLLLSPRDGDEATGIPLERADTQNAGLIRPAFVRARGMPVALALTVAAPLLWAIFDWITAGSPTYSFTGTRETVETLERQTGPVDLVLYGPRRLGEVLQWPGMVGAAGGVALGLALLRRRSTIGVTAVVLALGAFAILASAGLAIIPRYTMLAAAVLAVFAALALLGWRLLEPGCRWRRPWQAFAAVVALMFVAWGPNQYDLLHRVDADLTNQRTIEEDLRDLAASNAFEPLCLPISVPNHRAVPRLAWDVDVRPTDLVSTSSEERQPRRGYFLDPANAFTVHNFILDPNDPARLQTPTPSGFRRVTANDSWVLYRRC